MTEETNWTGGVEMNYAETLQFLHELQWFGAELGLERARVLARCFGHPEDRLRFIHVAGTNGKGSACAMLESVYRHSGLRVGLYTSPHLVRFGERIQVDRTPVTELELGRLAGLAKEALRHLSETPTFFEVATAMALRHFADQQCDLVIWENRIGRAFDATNIVTPLASVITNVQFDHQNWLGATLPQIAFEKAGIIKPFRPVITGAESGEGLDTILRVAAEQRAPLAHARHPGPFTQAWSGLPLPLPGAHQWQNAAVALATIRELQGTIPVSDAAIEAGLRSVRWPGRFQVIELGEGGKVILDGAHNPAGMLALGAALGEMFPGQRLTVILGAMRDKDWPAMSRAIAPLASVVRVVPTGSARRPGRVSGGGLPRGQSRRRSQRPCFALRGLGQVPTRRDFGHHRIAPLGGRGDLPPSLPLDGRGEGGAATERVDNRQTLKAKC